VKQAGDALAHAVRRGIVLPGCGFNLAAIGGKGVPALPFLPSPEQKRSFRMLYHGLEAAGGRCIQPKAGK